MKKVKLVTSAVVASGLLTVSALGVASAATTKSTDIGTSGIARSVFRQERQEAASQVLDTDSATIKAAHKNKTFDQLLSKAGLTKQTYAEKLKAQLTTDLEAKGYSQAQVTIALQHKQITRLHHEKTS